MSIVLSTGCGHHITTVNTEKSLKPGRLQTKTPSGYEKEFLLGTGDELSVSVWRQDNLSAQVTVDAAGNVYIPLAGKIRAQDRTASQVKDNIEKRLQTYIVDPVVTVSIQNIASKKIFVLGEVKTPGSYSLTRKMSLWEAVALAGGFLDDAKKDWLFVLKRTNNQFKAIPVSMDLGRMMKSGSVADIYYPGNGDIIYVETKTIASVEKFMGRLQTILIPLFTFEKIILSGDAVEKVLSGGESTPFIYD
ncbi:MAG: polysaccharide biosynthesis/export family protein [Desulfobacteraceae bacterium]